MKEKPILSPMYCDYLNALYRYIVKERCGLYTDYRRYLMNVFDTEYIENDLRNKGFNPGHDGYYYLVYLFKCNLDMKILSRYKRLTDIYCDIARRYNKSPHVIRLSIKYAIDSAYAYQRRHGLNTFEYYRLNGDNITIKEFVTQWRREQDEKRAFD